MTLDWQAVRSGEYFKSPEYQAATAREEFLVTADPADLSEQDRREREWLIICAYSPPGYELPAWFWEPPGESA
jgi:hypothetical protein